MFIAFDTVPNMVFSVLPMVVRAPMAATETRAAMRPYSMAVASDSSPQKSLNHFNMIGSPVQRIVRGAARKPLMSMERQKANVDAEEAAVVSAQQAVVTKRAANDKAADARAEATIDAIKATSTR